MRTQPVRDAQGSDSKPLATPRELKQRLPAEKKISGHIRETRNAIRNLLHGRDTKRLLIIAGPCSIHDPEAALEYAARLKRVADDTQESLVLVMRTYFEKPRTRSGWKGYLNDPRLDGSCDIGLGLSSARETLLAINALGVACGSELLNPLTATYLSDLLSWVSIGARTVESQSHRELASGLEVPVGFKNPTCGSLEAAANAAAAASQPQFRLGIDEDGRPSSLQTPGNPDCHLVLRGGRHGPNCDPASLEHALSLVRTDLGSRPIAIDCSHDNSGKDPQRQENVCREALAQFRSGTRSIMALLLESHLRAGRQTPDGALRYGVSITDACMGWAETEALLYRTADTVKTSH